MVDNGGKSGAEKRNMIIVLTTIFLLMVTLITLFTVKMFEGWNKEESGITMDETPYNDQDSEEFARQELKDDSLNDESIDDYIANARAKIDSSNDPQEKADLYIDLADEIYSRPESTEEQYVNLIMNSIYKAEELAPSAKTAWSIYNYELVFNGEERANPYLELAKERGYNPEEGEG